MLLDLFHIITNCMLHPNDTIDVHFHLPICSIPTGVCACVCVLVDMLTRHEKMLIDMRASIIQSRERERERLIGSRRGRVRDGFGRIIYCDNYGLSVCVCVCPSFPIS